MNIENNARFLEIKHPISSINFILYIIAAPSGPPEEVRIDDVSAHELQLVWKPPLKEKRNGIILEYIVRLNSSFGAEFSYNTADNQTDFEVINLRAYTQYSITVQAKNAGGLGPASHPLVQTTLESRKLIKCLSQ